MEENDRLALKLRFAKLICMNLAVFDTFLGGASALAPRFVLRLFSPDREPEGLELMRRTGSLWLFFVPVQAWAAANASNPKALRAVSLLRLMEVPADPVWLATGERFGAFGKFGLVFAPIANLLTGLYLRHVAKELERREHPQPVIP